LNFFGELFRGNLELIQDNAIVPNYLVCNFPKNCSFVAKFSAVETAIRNGNLQLVQKYFVTDKVSVSIVFSNMYNPLHIAAESGQIEIMKFLLKFQEIKIDGVATKKTPLYIACANGRSEIAELLIDRYF
jgi:ankyrin repeat protein